MGERYRSPPPGGGGRPIPPELPAFAARIVFHAGFGIENHGRPLRHIVGGPIRNLRVVWISRLRKRDPCRSKAIPHRPLRPRAGSADAIAITVERGRDVEAVNRSELPSE